MTTVTMPAGNMGGGGGLPATKLSKAALCSLIFGVLGCIPFAMGALAVLFGIIGFVTAGKPGMKGRWMAIVGGILGVVSLIVWSIVGVGALGVAGALALTAAPRDATHAFLADLAAGNVVAAEAKTGGISQTELQAISDYMSRQGKFEGATFLDSQLRNDRASLKGIVTFSGKAQRIEVELEKQGAEWKVMQIEIKP